MFALALVLSAGCGSFADETPLPTEDIPVWPRVDSRSPIDTVAPLDTADETTSPLDTKEDSAAPDITTDTIGPDTPSPDCQPGEGCFQDPCSIDMNCASDYCTEHLGHETCSMLCDDECPTGWACTQDTEALPEAVFFCLSGWAHLCRPCADTSDCAHGPLPGLACLDFGEDGGFCGGPCGDSGECPDGYSCKTALTIEGDQVEQCVPDSGICACTPLWAEEGAWTPCHDTSEFGTCDGTRTCLLQGLTACDAGTAAAEVCDGKDNDCDDAVDEDGEASICDDSDPCTVDSCVGFQGCVNAPMAECCISDDECTDSSPCTTDLCVNNQCQNDLIQGCCVFDADCEDADPCTEDDCEGNQCANTPIPECCVQNGECTDGNLCTNDACTNNQCVNTPVPDCCAFDADCSDGDVCTDDECDGNLCSNQPIPGCCIQDSDCDDSNPCTTNTCEGNQCQSIPVQDCCTEDVQCNDDNVCTEDHCQDADCTYITLPGCCQADEDCDDDIPCTLDQCDDNTCQYIAGGGCCGQDSDCDDGDPCTVDSCDIGLCAFSSGGTCVTLTPVEDTWLEGTSNKGGYDFLIVGKTSTYEKKRTLMRFDLSSIPADANILSADLRIYYYVSTKPSGVVEPCIDRTIMVNKMLVPWVENQATKVKATYSKNWSANWVGVNDVDAEMIPLDAQNWTGCLYEWKTFSVTPAAQAWGSDPGSNYGVLIWATNEDEKGMDMRFYSREWNDSNFRPQLVVVYVTP